MEMIFNHVSNPCEYLLLDNVCSQEELKNCFNETKLIALAFKEPKETGSAKDNFGNYKKQNMGVFLSHLYTPQFAMYSPITNVIHSVITKIKSYEYTPHSQFNYLRCVFGYDVLVSAYKNNDYYSQHFDAATLTLLFWFGEENINGGDLNFPEFNHVVKFKSNRAIIFPSYYQHEVTKVKAEKDGYVRYCATSFMKIDDTREVQQPITVGTNDF